MYVRVFVGVFEGDKWIISKAIGDATNDTGMMALLAKEIFP